MKNPHFNKKSASSGKKANRTRKRTGMHLSNTESLSNDMLSNTGGATCPICTEEIGPGHSSQSYEGVDYCVVCAKHLPIVRALVDAFIKENENDPTLNEINERLSQGGRAPLEPRLRLMLMILGYREINGKWSTQALCLDSGDSHALGS
jgi:hypothetical protein